MQFEDGELIESGYVEIEGKKHPIHMPKYRGKTPLTSENLNKMQADLKSNIKDIYFKGIVLYEDAIGTSGNVTFSSLIENGDMIEITYCRRKTNGESIFKTSGKISYEQGLQVALDMNYYSGFNHQSIAKRITVNNQNIINNGENTVVNYISMSDTETIYITKVVKYEEVV